MVDDGVVTLSLYVVDVSSRYGTTFTRRVACYKTDAALEPQLRSHCYLRVLVTDTTIIAIADVILIVAVCSRLMFKLVVAVQLIVSTGCDGLFFVSLGKEREAREDRESGGLGSGGCGLAL